MNISINDQDIAVSEYLKSIGIKYFVSHLANRENDLEWQCDEWVISFKGESFTFKTGLGHRLENKGKRVKPNPKAIKDLMNVTGLSYSTVRIVNGFVYAVIPTQASVLYCLLMDAQANDESFNNWCDNYGYDNDSMKAFKIYQSCCDTAEKLNKIFTREQQNKLSELLEDY